PSVTAWTFHGIAVHPANDEAVKLLLDLRLQLLGAEPHVADLRLAALRALLRRRLLVTAVVAEHHVALAVVGQRQVAEAARLDVAGVVARRSFHRYGPFILLIYYDQAELPSRGKYRAASADDHLHLARRDAPPVAAALRIAEMAVQHGDLAATATEAGDGLRRQ